MCRMRRNVVIDHRRANALKRAQAVLQRSLSTPAKVANLCEDELEDLQDCEVEVRHCLSLDPRRRQLRLPRSSRRGVVQTQMIIQNFPIG